AAMSASRSVSADFTSREQAASISAPAPSSMIRRSARMGLARRAVGGGHARLGRRDGRAFVGVFVQLVAQGSDRDAQDGGRMGAVAQAVVQGVEDQGLFHLSHGLTDE